MTMDQDRPLAGGSPTAGPLRLGFAVKVLGRPGLKSNDARRWRSGPHLRVSIAYLRESCASTYRRLPEPVRRRLVLENDDVRYGAADVLAIHEATGVPLIFDHQHHWCNNPEGLDLAEALRRFLRTWPAGVRPKVHFSSPR